MKRFFHLLLATLVVVLAGCGARAPKQQYDYTELQKSNPKSILVVMPTNSSLEVNASTGVLSQATIPLAELGYYVFPVALVDEVFKQNGLNDGHEIQATSIKKLHQIFGADAAMYLDVEKYGTEYKVFDSITTVSIRGKLVDLKTGTTLWEGAVQIHDGNNQQNGNVWAQLITAAITQIVNSTTDKAYNVAGRATSQLFYVGSHGGLLKGPRFLEKNLKP